MTQIVIEVDRGCYNIASAIPDGIELVIKDYDVIEDPNSPTQKNDMKGIYEEAVYSKTDNESVMNRMSNRKKGK